MLCVTYFSIQGVTRHGDAWARLAQRHMERGVVVVGESDHGEDSGRDDYYDGVSCGDAEPRAPTPAGRAAKKKRDRKKKKNTGGGAKEAEKGGARKRARVSSEAKGIGGNKNKDKDKDKKRKSTQHWSKEEHQRFLEVRAVLAPR